MDREVTWVDIGAWITIPISSQDIEEAEGDYAQAVQNVIGHTGAKVVEVDTE